MNKIFIEGYDDNPVISFEHIAPEPNRSCTGSSSYSIWGMDQNSIKIAKHIFNAKTKFNGNIKFGNEQYRIEGCTISNVYFFNHSIAELLIEWIE